MTDKLSAAAEAVIEAGNKYAYAKQFYKSMAHALLHPLDTETSVDMVGANVQDNIEQFKASVSGLLAPADNEEKSGMTLQLSKATKAVGDKLWENLTADDEGSAYAECYAAAIRGDADAVIGELQTEILEVRNELRKMSAECVDLLVLQKEYESNLHEAWQAANPDASEAEGAPGDNTVHAEPGNVYKGAYEELVGIVFEDTDMTHQKVGKAKAAVARNEDNGIKSLPF